MEQYVRDYPAKDLKLFPNLAYLVPEGTDLDELPSLDEINGWSDAGSDTRREDAVYGGPEVPEPKDDLEPVSPFGSGTAMGNKLRAKAERDRKAKSGGAAVREERSVEDIKRDVDGMAVSAEAHRSKGRGGPDGPR